jgi:hypothetical protein
MQALVSHHGIMTGDDFADALLNASTGGSKDDENLAD